MPRPPAHDTSALLQDLADTWRCKVADLSCGKETLLQRLWAGCVGSAAGRPSTSVHADGHELWAQCTAIGSRDDRACFISSLTPPSARSNLGSRCWRPRRSCSTRGCHGRYGTVNEVSVLRKDTGVSQALVIKRVRPPAGSGVSHQRKLKSYQARSGGLTAGPVAAVCAVHRSRWRAAMPQLLSYHMLTCGAPEQLPSTLCEPTMRRVLATYAP